MAGGTTGSGLRRTRFAPSPTGPLHLGHAFAALTAARLADTGQFLLRIEDIDRSRCRPEWEAAIYEDLHWLGLDWPQPVMRQSERLPAYQAALDSKGLGRITTEISPAGEFFFAETYHQQYLAKNPNGYCGLAGTGVSCPIGLGVPAE